MPKSGMNPMMNPHPGKLTGCGRFFVGTMKSKHFVWRRDNSVRNILLLPEQYGNEITPAMNYSDYVNSTIYNLLINAAQKFFPSPQPVSNHLRLRFSHLWQVLTLASSWLEFFRTLACPIWHITHAHLLLKKQVVQYLCPLKRHYSFANQIPVWYLA